MADTSIEWTERTWNPIVGCSLASPGCTNCYAMKMAGRLEAMGVECYQGTTQKTKAGFVWTGKIAVNESAMLEPWTRKKPTVWFVNSMSDLFHPDVPEAVIDRVFAVMAMCPQHTFQVLTKRPYRMQQYLAHGSTVRRIMENVAQLVRDTAPDPDRFHRAFHTHHAKFAKMHAWTHLGGIASDMFLRNEPNRSHPSHLQWPLLNVWVGASIEDNQRMHERANDLAAVPAAVRFWSAEPLLGPIANVPKNWWPDWVICGGESGARARPMHPDWARSLRDQCTDNGVPFFFKQWGDWAPHVAVGNEHGGVDMVPPVSFKAAHRWRRWDHGRSRAARADESVSEFLAPGVISVPVGKKAAGRLLDGVQHDGIPTSMEAH